MAKVNIAVVAPGRRLVEDAAVLATQRAAAQDVQLTIHPQCHAADGHFAGSDDMRLAALRGVLADPQVDAIWFARGGYGSNRIAIDAMKSVPPAALGKRILGYSDMGFLLSALHKAGLEVAHGPMVQDGLRDGGAAALDRAIGWLSRGSDDGVAQCARPTMAFNLTVLNTMIGTPLEPELSGRDLMIEDVSEPLYRIDRAMFQLTSSGMIANAHRLRIGRFDPVPDNEPPFLRSLDEIMTHWSAVSGVALGEAAPIGHDIDNRIVPFS